MDAELRQIIEEAHKGLYNGNLDVDARIRIPED
jgi:hypothetical protein